MGEISLNVYDYCREMNDKNIVLMFKGAISQDVLADVGTHLRERFNQNNDISKKVFAIFVELAQNIYHHSAEKDYSLLRSRDAGVGLVLLQDQEHHLVLGSGNVVNKEDEENLVEKCNYINSLDNEGLKKYYVEQRKAPKTGVGANIGLIDMARKSGNQLEYKVVRIDDENSFFSLCVKVDKNKVLQD